MTSDHLPRRTGALLLFSTIYSLIASFLFAAGFLAYQGSEPVTFLHVFWLLLIVGTVGYAIDGLFNLISYRRRRGAIVARIVSNLHKATFPRSDYKRFVDGHGSFPLKAAGTEAYIGEIAGWAQ
jgi:hypothetical protein